MKHLIYITTLLLLISCSSCQTETNKELPTKGVTFYTSNQEKTNIEEIKEKWLELLGDEATNIILTSSSISKITDEKTDERSTVLLLKNQNESVQVLAQLEKYKDGYQLSSHIVCCKNCETQSTFQLVGGKYSCFSTTSKANNSTTTIKCKKIEVVKMDDTDSNEEASKEFRITLRYEEENKVKMTCIGCAWGNLIYYGDDLLDEQTIDEYGMKGKEIQEKAENDKYPHFEFTVERNKEGLKLIGSQGVKWDELTFDFSKKEEYSFGINGILN